MNTPFAVFEGVVEYDDEDYGQALIATISDGNQPDMFVRIQAWEDRVDDDTEPVHAVARSIEGKKVRVTIEVLE